RLDSSWPVGIYTHVIALRGETRGRRGLGKGALAMGVAPLDGGRNRIMIYGPKPDGTYGVEFKTTHGEALAMCAGWGDPRAEIFPGANAVWLFVPDVSA